MRIEFNTYTMHLNDLPIDAGYASEKVVVVSSENKEFTLGGQNGKTQLIITLPFLDESVLNELHAIDETLPNGGTYEVTASLVLEEFLENMPSFKNIQLFADTKEEVRDFYGVKLSGAPFDGNLTKALILISKDGAVFYNEFLPNLTKPFNHETLQRKIYAAQTCYTGKGCH